MRRAAAVAACAALAMMLGSAEARASAPPRLPVSAAAMIDAQTGQRLYSMQGRRELPIASTTKLMTALLVLEHVHRLSRVFTAPPFYLPPEFSQIGLAAGERMSVHDLLLALLLPSADDAAEDLAYNLGHRSVARFVGMMNARARRLGLRRTHYTTPIGLDTPGNYSSALDLVVLARYLLAHEPFFRRAVAAPRAVLYTGNRVRVVVNRNDLVGRVPWINGVKTGHTLDAGYVLVASGTQRRMTLISAVLGASSEQARDATSLALLRYGFANFRLREPVVAGQVLARRPVRGRPGVTARLIAESTFVRVLPRATRVRIQVQAPAELVGPLPRHAVAGVVRILVGRRTIGRIALLAAQAVPAVPPMTVGASSMTGTFTLVLLALVVVSLVGTALMWRHRSRRAHAECASAR